jgi:hypothetical protein
MWTWIRTGTTEQFKWPQRPCTIEVALKPVFVSEAIDTLKRGMLGTRTDGYKDVRVAIGIVPPQFAEGTAGVSPENFQRVVCPIGAK